MNPCQPVSGAQQGYLPVAVTGMRQGKWFEQHDPVAQEVPIALEYNGISHAVMLATPLDMEDFAMGFSVTEGIVDAASDIRGIEAEPAASGVILHIDISASHFSRLKEHRRTLVGRTGCGLCGTESLAQALRPAPVVKADTGFDAMAIAHGVATLRSQQPLLLQTGATHAAAWCSADGTVRLLREDVGRHNALDKLVGALLSSQLPCMQGFIVVTSRASYEMVHKAGVAGVGLLAAVSGATALAVEMAHRSRLSLLGFVRGEDFSVYTHPERIWSTGHGQ